MQDSSKKTDPGKKLPLGSILKAVAVAAACVVAFFAVRALVRPFVHSGRETVTGAVTVGNIIPTGQLRVMSVYKEIIVGSTKTDNMLIGSVDRKIYAVYPAQLNLGYDFSRFGQDALRVSGDTAYVKLPPVQILNEGGQFVDEARMRVPIQTGKWTWREMEALREKANREMLYQCYRDGSMNEASLQGRAVIEKMLTTLGCKAVVFLD